MDPVIVIGSERGILIAQRGECEWYQVRRGLFAQHVTSLIAREGAILAGTTNGVFRSDDAGQTWREASAGLTERHVRWLAHHPEISDREFAGTEPAGILVSHDGAQTWRQCPEVAQLRDRLGWMLPYSPEAGCVRGFAFQGDRAYAAVEVGGVLRSDDVGETWRLAEGSDGQPDLDGPPESFVYADVHSIHVHPSSPDRVYAPTGGGFYRSEDGGRTWTLLYDCYCRAVWINPLNPDHMILGPADHVERNGRIEETLDGGETWRALAAGLSLPWPQHMVERFVPVGDELFALLSNGELLVTALTNLIWQPVQLDAQAENFTSLYELRINSSLSVDTR
jgi:photosystem II stability/assembly factor-like uncharacterized protein